MAECQALTPTTRAVFLDRDGTIIRDVGYLRRACQVELVPGAAQALAELGAHGFKLVLVSNQSGVGRGLITPQEAQDVHERMVAELAAHCVRFDAVHYCPHAPEDHCPCRKPSPALLLQAARELGIDLSRSFMVGDKGSDVQAGSRAGCRTILLTRDVAAVGPSQRPDCIAADWAQVLRLILDRGEGSA